MLKVAKTRKSVFALLMAVIMLLMSLAIPVMGEYETECDQYLLGEITRSKQYRYRVVLHQESTETSIEGWIKDENETVTYGSWTNVGWTSTKPTESDTLQITDKKTEQQYRYKTYKSGSYYHFCPAQGKAENAITYSQKHSSWSTTRYSGETHTQQHTTAGGATTSKACSSCGLKTGQHPKHYIIGAAHYYYEEARTVEKSWYYQKRTKNVSYNYTQLQSWSEWSFDEITSVDELNLGLSEGISATIETESRDVLTDKYGVCYSSDMTELYSVPKELSVNEFYVPDTVTRIGEKAFNGCTKIKKIILPSSVTSIASKAFSGCIGLEEIVIPVEATEIAEDAFEGCTGLKKILYTGREKQWEKFDVILRPGFVSDVVIYFDYTYDILRIGHCGEEVIYKLYSDGTLVISGTGPMYDFSWDDDEATGMPSYMTWEHEEIDGEMWIVGDETIKKVVIESGVTTIGDYAFNACTALESVEISDTVTSIGAVAFDYCIGLKHIDIPGSVKVIKEEAFSESGLETIRIENGLEQIDQIAFMYCQSLKEVALPESVTAIGDFAFIMCDKLETLIIDNKDCVIGLEILMTGELDEDGNPVEDENGNPIPTECPTVMKGYSGSTAEEYAKTWTEAGYPIKFEALDHTYIEIKTVPATCTERGYTLSECTKCGLKKEINIIAPLGHNYTEKIMDAAHLVSTATYEKGSVYKFDCSRCESVGEETFECDDKLVAVTGVTLNKTSITLKKGDSQTLTATVKPDNAADKKVKWSSSNTSVATVDSGGKVKAVGKGTATITAKNERSSKSATCNVTVTVPVTGVKLQSSLTMLEGEAGTLTATVSPSDANNKSVTWKSNNTSVLTVDSNGKIKAVSYGSAKVTVTTKDGNYSASCTVTVKAKVRGVHLNTSHAALMKGETKQLTATINPAESANKNVSWKSSDTKVIKVSNKGLVTAVGPGSAAVTVTTEDGKKTDVCYFDVTNCFALGMDNNSFLHRLNNNKNSGFYGVKTYKMTDTDKNLLKSLANKSEKDKVKKLTDKAWTGACFGISTTIGLNYMNKVESGNFVNNSSVEDYYSLPKPNTDTYFLSKIHFYHMLQSMNYLNNLIISRTWCGSFVNKLANYFDDAHVSMKNFLKKAVETAKIGNPFLFCYIITDNDKQSGHTVLVYDMEQDDNYYYLKIYDCNSVDLSNKEGSISTMRIKKDYTGYYYKGVSTVLSDSKDYIYELTIVNLSSMPILSSLQPRIASTAQTASSVIDTTEICFGSSANFKVVNQHGETLSYDGKSLSGDMNVYDVRFISDDNDSVGCTIQIQVAPSDTFEFIDLSDSIEMSVMTEETYLKIDGENIDAINVNADSDVTFSGTDFVFEAAMSVDGTTNDENGFAAIKANSTETTVVKRVETRLIAQTEGTLSDASVKIFTDKGVNTTQIKTAEKNIVAETDEDSVCSCNCHKKGIIGFFWRIINFFNKLFRNNKTCDCGVAHY